MRAFDLSPMMRSSIGFDNVNRLFELANRVDEAATSYPPYNIEKRGEGLQQFDLFIHEGTNF